MINYDAQREELVTKLKEKCQKEIDDFRNNEQIRKYLSEFERRAIFEANIVECLSDYLKCKSAFNERDFYGNYLWRSKFLALMVAERKVLNIIFGLFQDKESFEFDSFLLGGYRINYESIGYAISVIDEILFDKEMEEKNDSN